LNIDEFVRERKADWQKLEAVAGKLRPGALASLSRDELWTLGRLYTAAVSDLSVLRSSKLAADPENEVIDYLNGLVTRIHGMIYRKPAFHWASVRHFLTAGFPETFRNTLSYTLASVSIFLLFVGGGFFLGVSEPGFVELLVPEHIIAKVEKGDVWFDHLHAVAPQASSLLMTHNISVTFLVVAAGITFGVGTVYLLALNGLLLGAVAALCFNYGLSLRFWSFVLPHGSLELSAVCIAGAAGLVLGHALVEPGPYHRSEYLSVRGKLSGRLALGCIPLLVIAGIIEAFFSPSSLPAWMKLVFAGISFSALNGWLFLGGKRAHSGQPSDETTEGEYA